MLTLTIFIDYANKFCLGLFCRKQSGGCEVKPFLSLKEVLEFTTCQMDFWQVDEIEITVLICPKKAVPFLKEMYDSYMMPLH